MKSKILFLASLLVLIGSAAGAIYGQSWPGWDGPYPLKAALNSMQVVPQNGSAARARCKATGQFFSVDPWNDSTLIQAECQFSGLSGPLTGIDIRIARNGENGPGLCDLEKTVMATLPNTGSGTAIIRCLGGWHQMHLKDEYTVLQTALYPDGEIRGQFRPAGFDIDVDGEGRAEVSLFRPSDGLAYSFSGISNKMLISRLNWNPATDGLPFLADFDGDGIADWSLTRTRPDGRLETLHLSSWNGWADGCVFGNSTLGDIPAYGDYNGNGTTDCAVFRTTTGDWWFEDVYNNHSFTRRSWGGIGTATPCPGDYDADGKTDLCLIREENGQRIWSILRSLHGGETRVRWGLSTDEIYPNSPADFDGDGVSDIYIARIENGLRYFWILKSTTGEAEVRQWGFGTDMVKIADYDGDAIADLVAIREINNQLVWYINQSSDGQLRLAYWGLPGDK